MCACILRRTDPGDNGGGRAARCVKRLPVKSAERYEKNHSASPLEQESLEFIGMAFSVCQRVGSFPSFLSLHGRAFACYIGHGFVHIKIVAFFLPAAIITQHML